MTTATKLTLSATHLISAEFKDDSIVFVFSMVEGTCEVHVPASEAREIARISQHLELMTDNDVNSEAFGEPTPKDQNTVISASPSNPDQLLIKFTTQKGRKQAFSFERRLGPALMHLLLDSVSYEKQSSSDNGR